MTSPRRPERRGREPAAIPGNGEPRSRRQQHVAWLALILPAIAAFAFVALTHEVWEDFLITFRHTENLVHGQGLVYYPGERVYGFTSVLNVLVPALPLLVFGTLDASLWAYRLCSLAVLLGGLLYLWRALAARAGARWGEILIAAFLVATSTKIIAFTMNGQEAGFLAGFLGLALGAALHFDEPGAWRMMGISWAGLLYSRPDSPVYIVLAAGIVWFVNREETYRILRGMLRAGGIAAAAYAPWFVFAWIYYGSPVPHTVTAKAADQFFVNGDSLATFAAIWANYIDIVGEPFGPIYGIGDWPGWIAWGVVLGGLVASLLWIIPQKDRFLRACSFALMVALIYQSWLRVQRDAYPWYFPPASLLAIVVVGRAAAKLWFHQRRWGRTVAIVGVSALALASGRVFALSQRQLEVQQVEIEENVRKQIGLWLALHAVPGESVYLEPLGYIGYYSKARMLDFPGLVAPDVVRARREYQADFVTLPEFLKPEWIVARRSELELLQQNESIVDSYEVAQVFDATERLDAYPEFPGKQTLYFDSQYAILRRKAGR